MADPNPDAAAAQGGPAGGGEARPQLQVRSQYVKDLSYENPGAPGSLGPQEVPPDISVNVQVEARALGDDLYEVSLQVTARASRNDAVVFLVETTYCGLFFISGVPKEALEPLLLVECPRQIFPFVRRIVADTSRDGGYPPLLLNPIDFLMLYRQRSAETPGGEEPAAG